jgi:LPXTG-motif cell wall-anchored protein
MKLFATFDGAGWSITQFDFDKNAVWGICDGSSYAYLRWENQRPSCSPSSNNQTALPAPSTTTPPTTVVPVDPAAPVLVNGVLPELSAGEVIVYENGAVITVERFVENQADLVLRDPGFELRLTGHCTNGCNIQTTSDGRHVVTLEQHNVVEVNGRDFQPGSTVYVWLFSAPILLGQLTVNTDGTFTGEMGLGDITPGNHTLQMNGTSSQGDTLSINLGVIVIHEQVPTPVTGVLPATGTNTTPILLLALTLLGLGLVTTSRRRASHN